MCGFDLSTYRQLSIMLVLVAGSQILGRLKRRVTEVLLYFIVEGSAVAQW